MKRRLRQLKACCFDRTVPHRRLIRRSSAEGRILVQYGRHGRVKKRGHEAWVNYWRVVPPARRLDSAAGREALEVAEDGLVCGRQGTHLRRRESRLPMLIGRTCR